MSANIDQLAPTKSLIDLSTHSDNDFGLQNFDLCTLFDDLLLAEYVDESSDGNCITRGGIIVPKNSVTRAWRLAKVLLIGTGCNNVKEGDIIIFPHDKGIPVKNITVDGHGELKRGIFLNEERLFGVVKPKESSDETVNSKSGKSSRK
jgi:co-chaperonin GroES (HSP10)